MGILVDHEIRVLAEAGMIAPYEPELVREQDGLKVISYGQSSMGYDIRVADEFLIFSNANCRLVDPKNIDHAAFVRVKNHEVVIPPNSFALAYSIERFKIPDDVLSLIVSKSTYARCGISVNCTAMEPGWTGHLTIEISNTTPVPVKVYADEGIAQAIFWRGQPCKVNYANRAGKPGKYMDQPAEVTLPKV